ncbi:MAG: ABC transporter permease [bacterium]|nr:ABC transporter permease [bacterium]
MDLLNKLTIKNLKLNKKRTIVTIIGIMLSVALITAVATMYSSAIKSLINFETYHKGNFHIAFYDVNENDVYKIEKNKGVEELYLTNNIGYAKLNNSKNEYKPYAYIKAFTNDALENLSIKLIDGRLPKNENEIVIPNHLKTNGRIDLKIGDVVTLDVGKRINEEQAELNQYNPFIKEIKEEIIETTTKTYKIVGIIERPATNIENFEAPGYTFITYLDKNKIKGNVDVYAKFNKYGSKNYLNVAANILEVDEEIFAKGYTHNFTEDKEYQKFTEELAKAKYQYDINGYLIMLENNPLDENTTGGLGYAAIIVCVIIVLTSVFCIKNSFDISITEKIKQYGMLRSIGATKKQIKRNVYYEGLILGIIGIPLGIILGLIASYILIIVSNIFLKEMLNVNTGLKLVLSISWFSIVVAIILGIITIYLSSLRSARKASIVSPINSIRNSADIKIKSKKIKSPKVINKLFGIGGEISYKNFKRNKKKYRTTVISIVVSVAVFIGLSYFINEAFNSVKMDIKTYDYNLSLSVSGESFSAEKENKFMDTTKLNNVEDYAIYKYNYLKLKNPKYNEEYISLNKLDKDYLNEDVAIDIFSIGDHQYKKYLSDLNLDYDEYQDKAILVSNKIELEKYDEKTGKNKSIYVTRYDYKNGDVLSLYNDYSKENIDIQIGSITDKKPFGEEVTSVYLIVSDKMFKEIKNENKGFTIYYLSNNPDKLQDDIDEMLQGEEYYLQNVNEQAKMMNNLFTLVAIFLYGFIIVISLIGITNIFNTITTNMNLRKQEFAMLKSIGMTSKEFKKMIRLESVFIGAKSLLIGIPIGIGISYLIYYFMIKDSNLPFTLPILAIIISIIIVYLLITLLMKYSMNKINKENTIDTIRNENI